MFGRFIFLIFLILLSVSGDAQTLFCGDLFEQKVDFSLVRSAQEIEHTIRGLSAMRMEIDLSHVRGERSPHLKTLENDYQKKIRDLLGYIEFHHVMTSANLFEKISEIIQATQHDETHFKSENAVDREKQQTELTSEKIDGSQIIIHQIEPGSFDMGEVGKQKRVTITKAFGFAATQTTQIVWKQIVKEAHVVFPGRYDDLKEDPSLQKGDLNPLETVSFIEIVKWIEAANALAEIDSPIIKKLIPGYRKGLILRLPTEAEWEFVASQRGTIQGPYHFSLDDENLNQHAWNSKNSAGKTHPVAGKEPLMIGGMDFYDLHGNVWEWVSDRFAFEIQGGIDPQGPNTGDGAVLRGGAYHVGKSSMTARTRSQSSMFKPSRYDSNSSCGFRLAMSEP